MTRVRREGRTLGVPVQPQKYPLVRLWAPSSQNLKIPWGNPQHGIGESPIRGNPLANSYIFYTFLDNQDLIRGI